MKDELEKISSGNLIEDARKIIETARANAVRSVDYCRVRMYWNLGRRIFEEEQHGKERADYGAYLVRTLAINLEVEYGSGFGVRQLERAKQFYRTYPIASTVRTQLNCGKKIIATLSQRLTAHYGKGYTYSALTRMMKVARF